MIKTKMTIPVRVLGIIGVLVLLISLYLPWATIDGELLGASGTFSAIDLVKNTGSNILSYFFMGVYLVFILAIVCLLYAVFGRPTTGLGVTMFITAGTYLVLLILLGSFFQSMMPGNLEIPGISGLDLKDSDEDGLMDTFEDTFGTEPENPDTDGDGLKDGEEVLDKPYSDPTKMDSDGDGTNDPDDKTPLGGANEEMEGGDYDYSDGEGENIGDTLDKVNEIQDKMNMFTNTTVEVENGSYITTGSSVFIIIIGIVLKVDRRKRKNLKIELKYHKKDLDSYKTGIEQALLDGYISEDERGMLDVQRRSMGITPDEHHALVLEMAKNRKANDRAVDELLSIIEDGFRYKGGGIFKKKRRQSGAEGYEEDEDDPWAGSSSGSGTAGVRSRRKRDGEGSSMVSEEHRGDGAFQEGREKGYGAGRRKGGRKEGRKEGRKGGRKEGRKGGRKEGRKGGRKGGRKEGRKERGKRPGNEWLDL